MQLNSYQNIYLTYQQEKKFLKELLSNVASLEKKSLELFAEFLKEEHPELSGDLSLVKEHIQGIYESLECFEHDYKIKVSILNVVEYYLQKMIEDCDFSELGYFQYIQNKYFELKNKFIEWEKQNNINNF